MCSEFQGLSPDFSELHARAPIFLQDANERWQPCLCLGVVSNALVHPRAVTVLHGMHLTNVVLGCTERQVGFDVVLPKNKLEQQKVVKPLMLLQAAFLLLALQGQLRLTSELKKGNLACTVREAVEQH